MLLYTVDLLAAVDLTHSGLDGEELSVVNIAIAKKRGLVDLRQL